MPMYKVVKTVEKIWYIEAENVEQVRKQVMGLENPNYEELTALKIVADIGE